MLNDLTSGFTWVDFADKTIRTVAVYGTLLILLRLGGKRQMAQLSTFDFVVILLLSNVVQNAIIGPENTLIGGLVGAAILVAVNFIVVFFAFLNPSIERDLRGRETTLVENGQPKEDELRRELISRSELESALRRQGYRGLATVDEVVLEPEGTLAVTEKPHPTIEQVLASLERIEQRLGTLRD